MLSETLLDTGAVAQLLGITTNALRHRLHRRTLTIPAKKVGAHWRFKRSDVEAFLATWPTAEMTHGPD